jgi:hypothetical protein
MDRSRSGVELGARRVEVAGQAAEKHLETERVEARQPDSQGMNDGNEDSDGEEGRQARSNRDVKRSARKDLEG